jgi:hypothetical protein
MTAGEGIVTYRQRNNLALYPWRISIKNETLGFYDDLVIQRLQ